MKWLVTILGVAVLAAMTSSAPAETTSEKTEHVHIPKVSVTPRLNDYLTKEAQPQGLRIVDFYQREPNDGALATMETTAYLSYDVTNLYAVFICKEDPRVIRAHVSRREEIIDDDRVSITLDTFHDGRRAYEFFVNPLGIQREGVITEGQDDDFSFDTLWHSEGRLTPDGFAVLIAIPFKSLRFHGTPDSTWGIALGRYSPATKEFSTWPHLTEKIESYVGQFGTLEAMGDSSPGHNMQFIPYVSFANQRFLDTQGALPVIKKENDPRGGLDAKIVLHDALTFDFTANPDFSQVESDEPQVTVNQRYEVFFPEKRPFFTEGVGFFQTPENLFFSRRIADPQFGLRMTGKIGSWALGALASDDRAPGQTLAANDPLAGDRADISIFRVQREVGKQSEVGFLFSRRHFGPSSNNVFSADARIKLSANWVFTGQAVHSQGHDLAGASDSGADYFAEIRHTGLHLNYFSNYLDRSPNFRADLGFIPRVDIRQLKNEVGYQWRPESGSLVSFGPTLSARILWDHRGQLQEWEMDAPFTFTFKGPTSLTLGHLREFETFQGLKFHENASYVYFSTQRLRWMGIDATFVHGTNINFFPGPGLLPFLANSNDASFGVTFRPTSRLRIDETYIFDRLGTMANQADQGVPQSTAIFNNHLFRTKANYQFTRALSLRAIVDYDATLPNSALVDLDRSKRLTGDVLLSYLLHPGTAVYIGYTDRRENLAFDPNDPTGLRRTGFPGFPTGRQFFVKVSYLFRF
jgi:uncharacterized protein DUF5916